MANKSQTVGANVDFTFTGTTTDGQNAPFALGTIVEGDGVRYRFVQANGVISTTTNEPYAVLIDENNQATKATTANALERHELGIAPRLVISDNDFFWARTFGKPIPLRVAASATLNASLRTTTTAGRLGTASTASSVVYAGCVIVVAASASGASSGSTIRNAILTGNFPVRQSTLGPAAGGSV